MMITDLSKRVIPFRSHDARKVGEGCFYLDQIVWLNGANIEMGDLVGFNFGCYVNGYGGLTIGDRTIIGPYTMIHSANHQMDVSVPIPGQGWMSKPVTIGADCWIGMNVCVLPGVTVGEGCIVGAASVVVKDLEPYSVCVGNPAKVIRSRL